MSVISIKLWLTAIGSSKCQLAPPALEAQQTCIGRICRHAPQLYEAGSVTRSKDGAGGTHPGAAQSRGRCATSVAAAVCDS